ncbi:DUF4352 domain-containing protein [Bacillus cereus]|uniref:Glycerophosphodiester phosphodiesterase n=1 Tax=Bacillus cereus TaxID=1396 RepID=A0AA44TCZ8_BACCE|nr:DUF4352 domain-containing protein [Bacillus cereus]PFN07562.1 glycerophosphodiester phosphodiesterase [Bacillus cereus]PFR96388.1 glycerophosphodiester phosphodiesterase [Bacillus cereus]
MKKPFYKKWWFWVIVVIIVVADTGNNDDKKEETKTTSTEPKQEVKQETKQEEQKKEEPKKELSKEGESSKVKIAVGAVESLESVGNEYVNEKAQGIFKVVEVSITNNQKDAITVDANSFKLVDNQDREFTYSTQGQTSFDIANGGKTDFFLKQLNPGLTQTGKIVFDVPKDAQGLILKARGGMTGKEIKLKVD